MIILNVIKQCVTFICNMVFAVNPEKINNLKSMIIINN